MVGPLRRAPPPSARSAAPPGAGRPERRHESGPQGLRSPPGQRRRVERRAALLRHRRPFHALRARRRGTPSAVQETRRRGGPRRPLVPDSTPQRVFESHRKAALEFWRRRRQRLVLTTPRRKSCGQSLRPWGLVGRRISSADPPPCRSVRQPGLLDYPVSVASCSLIRTRSDTDVGPYVHPGAPRIALRLFRRACSEDPAKPGGRGPRRGGGLDTDPESSGAGSPSRPGTAVVTARRRSRSSGCRWKSSI